MSTGEGFKSKLSLNSINQDKSSEKIQITIAKCKNLKPQKPEGITVFAKVEFNETTISESQKFTLTTDATFELNFNSYLTINTNDQTSLDDLAHKPVIVTLIEVLAKEKKQKEERIQSLGQTTFDLWRLLKGETKYNYKLQVHPIVGSPLELLQQQAPDQPLPELEIHVSVDQKLISEDELAKSNIVSVSLDSIYSTPDQWLNPNQSFAYTVSLPLPISDDKDNIIVFVNGQQKPPTEPVPKQKRWSDTRGIQATQSLLNANSATQHLQTDGGASEEEIGDFVSKEDREHRLQSEKEKPRVQWNTERKCYLNGLSSASLRDQVLKTRYWPLEIMRTLVPTGIKAKKDEEYGLSYHGIAYIDMAPLLYPGATHIKGAYKIYPYSESEFMQKTKRKCGITDDALKMINQLFDRNLAATPLNKKDAGKSGVEKKEGGGGGGGKRGKDGDSEKHDPLDSQQYLDFKSFIVIDIKFDKPIIPRKPFDVLAKRISELIPPRPKLPLRNNSADKAVQDYHVQLKSIVNLVLDDYRKLIANESSFLSTSVESFETIEMKRRKLLYELNSTGKYFAFKEQLKNSVIKIVREKFLRTSAFDDKDQMQQFLSELYVFLIDEMHKLLNQTISVEDVQPVAQEMTHLDQIKHFAQEAEMNKNYELANFYYQEKIAREKDNLQHWLDYSSFNFLIEDYPRAEECLKECISIQPNDEKCLMLFGVISTMQEKYDIAETFIERVINSNPQNVIAWCLYAMLYETTNQDLNAEITFNKAMKLNNALELAEQQYAHTQVPISIEDDAENVNQDDPQNNSKLTSDNKSRVPSKRGTSQTSKLKADLAKVSKSPGTSSQLAVAHPPQGGSSSLGLKSPAPPADQTAYDPRKSIFMKTAKFLLEYNAYAWAEKCLAKDLLNPKGGPSKDYHIALTRIKLAKDDLQAAEKHCCEALSFDYENPEAWALWAHTRYLQSDFRGARERYERLLQFPSLPKQYLHGVYIRLASIYLQEECYEDAKRLFLFACKNTASCMSWLGVGISCYRLGELEDAEDALSEANILNNKAPEVWAYLSLICLKTNRPLEAEQAYKYSIKLNLDNQELLEEIQILQEQLGFGNPEM